VKGILLLQGKGGEKPSLPGKKEEAPEEKGDSPKQILADMLGVDDGDARVKALKLALKEGSSVEEEA
jgi:hypothetical protein